MKQLASKFVYEPEVRELSLSILIPDYDIALYDFLKDTGHFDMKKEVQGAISRHLESLWLQISSS